MDANTEFAFVDNGAEFINSSMGFSPTISYLPTYPAPTIGLVSSYTFDKSLSVKLGVFSDENDSFGNRFTISEVHWQSSSVLSKIGYWRYDGQTDETSLKNSTYGMYATIEGSLNIGQNFAKSVNWYVQLAKSERTFNTIDNHIGLGIVAADVFSGENDKIGAGVTYISTTKSASRGVGRSETAFEVFYKYQVTSNLSIKPNFQYIVTPASQTALDDAKVATIRFDFSW